jgi:hypothetical protein
MTNNLPAEVVPLDNDATRRRMYGQLARMISDARKIDNMLMEIYSLRISDERTISAATTALDNERRALLNNARGMIADLMPRW